jgi:hypothetical protein
MSRDVAWMASVVAFISVSLSDESTLVVVDPERLHKEKIGVNADIFRPDSQ